MGIRELAEQAVREGAIDLAQGVIQSPPPAVLDRLLQQHQTATSAAYTNKRGVPAWREAVSAYLANRGWSVQIDQVLGTAGVTGATVSALRSHVPPGGTVLLPEPFFIGHRLMLETLGYTINHVPMPFDAVPNWDQLIAAMTEADALILTNPANPTGQTVPTELLTRLSQAATEHNCLLVLDEVYRDFYWNDEHDDSVYQQLDLSSTVVARSFSKSLAIPGWRVGFAISAPERIERMAGHHDALYIGASTLGQYVLAEAWQQQANELIAYLRDLRGLLQENLEALTPVFTALGMEPLPVPASYYLLLKHNRASEQEAFDELLAKKIVITPASLLTSTPDQESGFIRIHFGITAEQREQVLEQLM